MRRGGSPERPRHLIRRDRDGGIQSFSCVMGLCHVTSRQALTRYGNYVQLARPLPVRRTIRVRRGNDVRAEH